jgi:hypothetical protein
MSMLAFFPWFTTRQDFQAGPFEVVRYERSQEPLGQGTRDQETADKILGHYFTLSAQPLVSATIVKLKTRGFFDELSDDERSAVFALSELLALSGLACREFFRHAGQYCNRDHFRVVIQRFSDPQAGALTTTRRRDGDSSNYMSGAIYRVPIPEHVQLSPIPINVDVSLFSSLLAAQERDGWERFAEAILSFNLANTDSSEMSEHIEAVLLVSAFERLLECRGKEEDLAERFSDCLRFSQERFRGDCARLASGDLGNRFQTSAPIHEIWIRDFYRLRGNLAHGRIRHRYPAVWQLREHLLLGSYVFPLLVRSLLAEENLYSLTKDDQFHIDVFERLACERLFQPTGEESGPSSWPWNKILEEAQAERFHTEMVEKIRKKGFLEHS